MLVYIYIQPCEENIAHSIHSYVSQLVVAIMPDNKHPNNIPKSINIIVRNLDVS